RAISVFEELIDELELARAWQLAAHIEFFHGALATSDAMLERGLVHARRAGDAREEARILRWLASSALWGPLPVEAGIRRCEEILERTHGNSLVQANCHIRLAGLEGMRGRFSEARARVAQARAILTEFGLTYFLAHSRDVAALVETLAGNPSGAEAELRASYEEVRENLLWHGYALMDLAEVLRLAGRAQEAVPVVEEAAELFDRKGIVPAAEAAQALLAELEPA